MDEFRRKSSPYVNADALDESYQPEKILGRDEELEEIHSALQPIINREPPQNAFLYGLSGLGKTECMRYKIDTLTAAATNYDDITVESIWLNCDDLTSSYQVAIEIANTILPSSKSLPRSGLPRSQVYSTMFDALDQLGSNDNPDEEDDSRQYVLIILDEVDNIGSRDRLLYQIPRAKTNEKITQVWPAIIGISNDVTFKENLSSKVKSSLCEREIVFSRYDADQLGMIIGRRVEIAFRDGAVGENVIKLCAAYATQEGGDARYALDLLKVAADAARDRGDDTLTETDIEAAREQIKDTRVLDSVHSLTLHEQLTAATMVLMDRNESLPARRGEIYSQYTQVAKSVGRRPNKSRRFHDYMDNMSMLGLIGTNEVNKGIADASYYTHDLRSLEAEMVVTALVGDESESLVPSPLRQYI